MITFHTFKIETFGYDTALIRKLLIAAERKGWDHAKTLAKETAAATRCNVPPSGLLQKMMEHAEIPEKGVDCIRSERPGYAVEVDGVMYATIDRVAFEFPSLEEIYSDVTKGLYRHTTEGTVRTKKTASKYFTLYALTDVAKLVEFYKGDDWISAEDVREIFDEHEVKIANVGGWLFYRRSSDRIRWSKVGGRYLHHADDVRQEMQRTMLCGEDKVAA